MTHDHDQQDRLGRQLRALVPPAPPVTGWAVEAERRAVRERRRRAVGTAVLAAAVAAAAVVVVAAARPAAPPPDDGAGPAGRSDSFAAPGGGLARQLREGCPAPDTALPYPPGGELPRGAVAVRLCNVAGDLSSGGRREGRVEAGFDPPVEQLETGVDAVVDAVDAAPRPTIDACGGIGGWTSAYWFTYPDGTVEAVTWLYGDCSDPTVGPGDRRVGGADVHAAFARALAAQRATRQPPGVADPPSCNPLQQTTSTVVTGDRLDLAQAVLCVSTTGGVDDGRERVVQRAVLTPGDVAAVEDDIAARSETVDGESSCAPTPPEHLRIVADTVWGDRVVLDLYCRTRTDLPVLPRYPGPDGRPVWNPSVTLTDRLVALPREPPVPIEP